eukprot:gene24120-biopygen13424
MRLPHGPWENRTLARAWRGHGAAVARAIGYNLASAARAWRGHGAGMSPGWPTRVGTYPLTSEWVHGGWAHGAWVGDMMYVSGWVHLASHCVHFPTLGKKEGDATTFGIFRMRWE